jgi:Fe-S oxidoreductase
VPRELLGSGRPVLGICYGQQLFAHLLGGKVSRAAKRVVEFKRRGASSFCCGAGGGRMWMEETIGSRINEDRAKELLHLGVDHVFTACPFCLTMFEDALKTLGREDVKARDIAEVLLEACS